MYKNMQLYDKFVSPEDVALIHEHTLKVMGEVGVIVEHEKALELFRHHGAKVDGHTVFINEALLNKALSTVPQEIEVFSRGGSVKIGEMHPPATVGAFGPPKMLHEDGLVREALLPDVINFLKLTQSSDVISFTNNIAFDTPDLDKSMDNIYNPQVALGLKYSDKPTYGNVINSLNVKNKNLYDATNELVQMYQEFHDIWDKPVLMTNLCVLSPLAIANEVLENLIALVENNQPVTIIECSMTNLTSPPTLMGSIVQNNANLLTSIVLTQLITPGVGVVYGCVSAPTDMRSVQICIGAPEAMLIQMGALAMSRYYKIPCRVGDAATDAIDPDFQAGAESFMTLIPTMLGKADFCLHAGGILGSYALGSVEKFVLDEEIIRYMHRLNQGIAFSDKKANFDLIKKVGPRGNYLKGRTSKDYREEHVLPNLFNRKGSTQDVRENFGTLRERAAAEVQRRLNEYVLPDVTKKQKEILNQYLPENEKY